MNLHQRMRAVADCDLFPTCVGMNRIMSVYKAINAAVPHVRGDEPTETIHISNVKHCSPRAWG